MDKSGVKKLKFKNKKQVVLIKNSFVDEHGILLDEKNLKKS